MTFYYVGASLGSAIAAGLDYLAHRPDVDPQAQTRLEAIVRAADAEIGRVGDATLEACLNDRARLAQGDVQVYEAWSGDKTLGVDGFDGGEAGRCSAEGDDLAGFNVNIGDLIQAAAWIDDAGAENAELHWAFSCSNWRWAVCPLMAIDSTAIRIAMP